MRGTWRDWRALEGKDSGDTESLETLRALPPPSIWPKLFGYLVIALLIGGFVWAFNQGVDVGRDLVSFYVLATGGFAALGALIAGGHPLSILTAFVVSPLTPLHPALGSGTLSALVETWVRRPTVADFDHLRTDAATLRGWWRNRVTRVLLNFFLTSLGTMFGVWLAGWGMLKALF